MPASTCADGDNPIDAVLDGFTRMPETDHVMKDESTITMHCPYDISWWSQARDDDRNLVLDTGLHVRVHARVALVNDLVHGKRGNGLSRIFLREGGQFVFDLPNPAVECLLWPRIERWESTDNTGFALFDDEPWYRNDEHWRADQGQPKATVQRGG